MPCRRSWLIQSVLPSTQHQDKRSEKADVLVLDLEYSVATRLKSRARQALREQLLNLDAIQQSAFVRIDWSTRWADVRAAMYRGIQGLVLPGPENPEDIADIDTLMSQMERERGLHQGSTQIVLMLESARGFWNAQSLAQASPRVSALGVGRIDLTMDLKPLPQNEFRLSRYLMSRTVVAARMLGKQPLGAFWRPGTRGGVANPTQTQEAAREAQLMGYRGSFCVNPDQVAAINHGFSFE